MTPAALFGPFTPKGLEEALLPAVLEAGAAALAIYNSDFAVERKADSSPVTEADRKAEAILSAALGKIRPRLPIIAEEAVSAGEIPDVSRVPAFWLVDPVDGTKEFVGRTGEWTLNIGLAVKGRAIFGIIFAPVTGELYVGALGYGAWRQIGAGPRVNISARRPPREGLSVIVSRRHGDDEKVTSLLSGKLINEQVISGSSLKFCRIAEGRADVYPRFGPTSEWDTCAGHAILEAAGGSVVQADTDRRLAYAKRKDFLNPPFVAWGVRGRGVR